jgi:imidazolonepropionase-like amidohydrolase
MRGQEVIVDGTVVIERDRITAVGPRADIKIPSGARIIDVAGKTVVPGFIDNHWHGDHDERGIQPQQNWGYFATLAFGVTTAFDPSSSNYVFSSAEMARAGIITAPRILGTGPIIGDVELPERSFINSLDDARKYVRRRKAWGAVAAKNYLMARREQRQQVVEAARLEGIAVVAETEMGPIDILSQVLDGNTSIEHHLPLAHAYDDVLQLWSKSTVDVTPTFATGISAIGGEVLGARLERVWENPILSRYVPPAKLRAETIRTLNVQDDDLRIVSESAWHSKLATAGVRVLPGAHGEREGLGLHWEMLVFQRGGMAPIDVLASATIRSAEHLGIADDLGSIEPGKLADLVVIKGNPLEDIAQTKQVELVIANGRVFDPLTMTRDGAPRLPFWWEKDDLR